MGDRGTSRLTRTRRSGILQHHGFLRVGQSGSHRKWRNPATAKQVMVAHHRGHVLPPGTMKSIIEGSGIAPSEWFK
ncbi:MAG: type II toxin-antitoxin system HicA family toxin [Bryobacteraceae bacterium]